MRDERWGYAGSKDAEAWHGALLTREEAIREGRDYMLECGAGEAGCWIHSGHMVSVESVLPDVDALLERMAEQANEQAGEAADDYPSVTEEAKAELEALLRGWVEKHATPDFWVADGEAEFIAAPLAAEGKETTNG